MGTPKSNVNVKIRKIWIPCSLNPTDFLVISVLFNRADANSLQQLVRRKIALLQALLHANDHALWNLAPEAVDIASVDGGIWEAESGCNNL
jgi:hypothetical protein